MAENLKSLTKKRIHAYHGTCIVHETFTGETARAWKDLYPDAKMLVHTESPPDVVALADLAGGTGDMIRYVRESPPEQRRFMLVTECGLSDRLRVEFPDREFIGTCSLCPHMKRVELRKVLQVLESPRPDQVIEVPEAIRVRAKRAIDRMFELTKASPRKPHANLGDRSGRCE
jgi:quinolinate synthase